MIELLVKFWPFFVGLLGAAFGVFKHQQANTAKAEYQAAEAKADQMAAQATSARSDAIAAKTALARVQGAASDRAEVDAGVARTEDLDKALKDEGFTS